MIPLSQAMEIMAGARRQAEIQAREQRLDQMGWLTPGLLWPAPSAVLDAIDRWLFAQAGGSRPVEAVRAEWPAHRAMPEGLRQ